MCAGAGGLGISYGLAVTGYELCSEDVAGFNETQKSLSILLVGDTLAIVVATCTTVVQSWVIKLHGLWNVV